MMVGIHHLLDQPPLRVVGDPKLGRKIRQFAVSEEMYAWIKDLSVLSECTISRIVRIVLSGGSMTQRVPIVFDRKDDQRETCGCQRWE